MTEKTKFVKFESNFNAKDHVIELDDGRKANVVFFWGGEC